MRKSLVLATAVLLVAGLSQGAILGSKHDLSAGSGGAVTDAIETCVFCHTPHQAAAASGQDPLWNHTLSTAGNYGVYDSDTMDGSPTDFGGGGPANGSANASQLCMSCHDGTVSVASLYNNPNHLNGNAPAVTAGGNVNAGGLITGNPSIGTNLTDDHPVNLVYDSALASNDGELVTPDSASWVDAAQTVPLFATYIQCASCHDAHNSVATPFLVKDNTDSALCTTCHQK